jgi:16S rRNA (adenine1518-N6/adenine1519-N6)-dimethyltransferase
MYFKGIIFMSNLVQVVDEDDQPVSAATKQEVWARGLVHRIVQIVAVAPDGGILLQRRSPQKDLQPNKWDFSASGHVDEGEDYLSAARRELCEEAGIDCSSLREIAYYRKDRQLDDKNIKRFYRVYHVSIASDAKLTPKAGEVSELRWFTHQELANLLAQSPDDCVPSLRKILQELYIA